MKIQIDEWAYVIKDNADGSFNVAGLRFAEGNHGVSFEVALRLVMLDVSKTWDIDACVFDKRAKDAAMVSEGFAVLGSQCSKSY